MAQEAVCSAERVKLVGLQEERVFQLDLAAGEDAVIVEPHSIVGHNAVAKAIGRARELLGNARIRARIEAVVGVRRFWPEQLGQEFVIGDVGDLGADDGARLLVQMIAVPIWMLGLELVDLIVVLAHE